MSSDRDVMRIVLVPGDPVTGEWCPTCLLPSAIKVDVAWCDGRYGEVVGRSVVQVCETCGRTPE